MSAALLPLYQIEEDLESLLDAVDTCPEELRAELEGKIAAYLGAEAVKVDRVAGALAALENQAANAKAEIERLRDRQKAAERASERLKTYVLSVIERHGGKPLKGRNVTLSMRQSEAVVIEDMALIPTEWTRTTVTVDAPKEPIKAALRAGLDIPGARLEARPYLVRR